jgi:ABC-2 type transport system ATP-binding protein
MTAISGVSFGVSKGEVFTLLGINGAGKSSTFKCLVGLQDTSNGQIMLSHTD